jgi:aromatic-L-amino-acid/L-tryptophan decarboxylase
MKSGTTARTRESPLELDADEFRAIGHALIDRLAEFLETMPNGPVTHDASPASLRPLLGPAHLPDQGEPADRLVAEATELLIEHSLFNGHPRFWGFITSSAAPIGALADLLGAAINPNLGGWILAPIASEIERRTIRWIAELTGFPTDCGGLLVSGGNMANLIGFWVGRRVKTPWNLRESGYDERRVTARVYASRETHTWVEKAVDLSGLGTNAIRWIEPRHQRMDPDALRRQIEADRHDGVLPMLVVGTAGTVSTGAIDPLPEIAQLCREYGLWFHVDGAYGAPAAALPESPDDLKALSMADSLAIDPHKWLYAPLEAGCALVRDPALLRDTFSFHPPYYPDQQEATDDAPIYYHEFGPQNSRGFRALKVWLGLRQAGRDGLVTLIRDDIALAHRMFALVEDHDELEAVTLGLSIATFRYVPRDVSPDAESSRDYLDALNREILERMQKGGEAFVSNAVIEGRYLLRACIVNFRTDAIDVEALIDLVVRLGREVHSELSQRQAAPVP